MTCGRGGGAAARGGSGLSCCRATGGGGGGATGLTEVTAGLAVADAGGGTTAWPGPGGLPGAGGVAVAGAAAVGAGAFGPGLPPGVRPPGVWAVDGGRPTRPGTGGVPGAPGTGSACASGCFGCPCAGAPMGALACAGGAWAAGAVAVGASLPFGAAAEGSVVPAPRGASGVPGAGCVLACGSFCAPGIGYRAASRWFLRSSSSACCAGWRLTRHEYGRRAALRAEAAIQPGRPWSPHADRHLYRPLRAHRHRGEGSCMACGSARSPKR